MDVRDDEMAPWVYRGWLCPVRDKYVVLAAKVALFVLWCLSKNDGIPADISERGLGLWASCARSGWRGANLGMPISWMVELGGSREWDGILMTGLAATVQLASGSPSTSVVHEHARVDPCDSITH